MKTATPGSDDKAITLDRTRAILARSVLVGAVVLSGLSISLPFAGRSSEAAAATMAQTDGPISRPDLALSLNDLPPGYEVAPGLELVFRGTPLADRVIRRSEPGAGPGWVWTMTYQTAQPMTQAAVRSIGLDLAVTLSRVVGTTAELINWSEEDAAGLGTYATLYSFQYHVLGTDTLIDGALAIFGPGDYMSYLAVLSRDGQTLSDARRLANAVNARIAQTTSPR